jgi:hypothetical protein
MKTIVLFLFVFLAVGQVYPQSASDANDAQLLHTLNESLTKAVVFDGFSPPVASRIYAYCNIAAYEALRVGEKDKKSLINQLNSFDKLEDDKFEKGLDHRVVMVESFRLTAKDIVYRFFFVDSVSQHLLKTLSNKVDPKVYAKSIEAAEQLHAVIQKRIKSDNYAKTRDMPKYTPVDKDGHWQPTYPTYGDALEPYWKLIKPFTLDSLTQFEVTDPPPFSKEKGSAFYNNALEVYEAVNNLTPEQKEFCFFWDCNPQKTNYNGHIMYKTRQLTPGGHWVGITRYACLQNNTDLFTSAKIYALVTIAIVDGFINIWSEKFRTDNVRPETYIQENIDANWRPLLETPLFPEHPSAHSTISAAAGTVLDKFFDDNTAFMDSTEVPFGLKPRYFHSFHEAANEAANSRVYGGIHYRLASNEGLKLGRALGNNVLKKIKL